MLGAYAEVEDTFHSASRNLNPARTVERISRLCPRLQRLKILANDVSFRQLEQLNGIEEVILSPFLSTFLSDISHISSRLTSPGPYPQPDLSCV